MNICLLGDSILDNATYTDGAPAVTDHLNRLLGGTGRATLIAVDGSVTAQVHRQVRELPADATHLVLSSGGNDALAHEDLLRQPAKSVAQALLLFAEPLRTLEADYRRLLDHLRATGLPVLCCTIYNGWMDEEEARSVVPLALSLFNDVIFRLALEYRFPVLDLRRVCTEATDYANPIEPSGSGGEKIARAIGRTLSVEYSER